MNPYLLVIIDCLVIAFMIIARRLYLSWLTEPEIEE